MLRKKIHLLLILSVLASCSSVRVIDRTINNQERDIASVDTHKTGEVSEIATENYDTTSKRQVNGPLRDIQDASKDVKEADWQELSLNYDQKLFNFWIHYFTVRDRKSFEQHMINAARVRDIVKKVFIEHELPPDLFYVGLTESGFNMKIRSRANAVGPWQFIKGTGERYQLRIDKDIDERKNINKATVAAAKYFKDLYNIFGSWELALCAYNAGEYKIINAIRKGNTRDYQELVEKKLLPEETIYYIPKVIAAKHLFENFHKFRLPDYSKILISGKIYESAVGMKMKKQFSYKSLNKEFGVPLATLEVLNPDIKGKVVKASARKPVTIYLPGHAYRSLGSYVAGEDESGDKKNDEEKKTKKRTHHVKKGETLKSIAKKYKTTEKRLVQYNSLKSKKIRKGQKIIIPI